MLFLLKVFCLISCIIDVQCLSPNCLEFFTISHYKLKIILYVLQKYINLSCKVLNERIKAIKYNFF